MKDLNTINLHNLVRKIKSFLDITWDDEDTNEQIIDFINSSIRFLDETAGAELNYVLVPSAEEQDISIADKIYNSMCYLGQDLLKNRVFYLREKALDDFESNYQRELVALYNYGKIYKKKVEENVKQQQDIHK